MTRLMTARQLLIGSVTFTLIAAAGIVSYRAVDRTFALMEAAAAPPGGGDGAPPQSAPCVGKDGSWTHWPHANVPTLSPTCAE